MTAHGAAAHHDTHEHTHHVSSMPLLLGIFGALIVLTIVTVGIAYVDLGEANLPIAMLIATVKASLVAIYFMHLRHDSGFNRLAFFGCFAFVALFVGITLMDTGQYQDVIDFSEKVVAEQPKEEGRKPDSPTAPAERKAGENQ